MSIVWHTLAGNLGTLIERVLIDIPLSATSNNGAITYKLIAGQLPRGLRLSEASILGSPAEVRRYTTSRFVIRASDATDLEDRTFSLSIDGADNPHWITSEGFLNVGPAKAYFILDNSYVNFQLSATDADSIAGDQLEYYLMPMAGELPGGLTLSRDGIISGFTDPIFALTYNMITTGGYDTAPWDFIPLDTGEARSNGFDDYFYDNVTYDYSETSRVPRRLSRIYTFAVAVTDGVNSVSQLFKIYVVTEEFLQADNNIVQADTNLFQADSNNARVPIWITESNLGRVRADNYVTIFLDVYDPPTLAGTITYFLLPTNPGTYKLTSTGEIITSRYEISEILPQFKYINTGAWTAISNYLVGDVVEYSGDSTLPELWVCQYSNINHIPSIDHFWSKNIDTTTATFVPDDMTAWTVISTETISTLPPGMEIDSMTGDIAGSVPYQPRVSKFYQFTMMAVNFPAAFTNSTYTFTGDWNSYTIYRINDTVRYLGFIYLCTIDHRNHSPLDINYWFLGTASSEKTFTIELIGDIESAISWITDSNLGTIKPNQISMLRVNAESLLYGGRVAYEFVSGKLPPGLSFISTGDIVGKVIQFSNSSSIGLTRWADNDTDAVDSTRSITYSTTFDSSTTSFDQKFTCVIRARDSANFVAISKTFYITIVNDVTKTFANLYVKAFQTKQKRLDWYNFITDSVLFKSTELYRYGDTNFGVQPDLKMLVYAGIESVKAEYYIQAMGQNHNNKRLLFGDLKVGKAKDPITQEVIYEIIYIQVVDQSEKNGISMKQIVELPNNINSKVLLSYDSIKVDSNIPLISDSDHQRLFPNSIRNLRTRIGQVGENDREFLPLWMRSIQDEAKYELGYTKAIPLCYAKPNASAAILSRIKASNYDFKTIDFTADRYLIDVLDGEIEDKYLAFPQRGEKLP